MSNSRKRHVFIVDEVQIGKVLPTTVGGLVETLTANPKALVTLSMHCRRLVKKRGV